MIIIAISVIVSLLIVMKTSAFTCHKLLTTANLSEEQRDASHFCVWMTCKTDSQVPDHLIQHLHKVSWTHVLTLAKPQPQVESTPAQDSAAAASGAASPSQPKPAEKTVSVTSYLTPGKYLREGQLLLMKSMVVQPLKTIYVIIATT